MDMKENTAQLIAQAAGLNIDEAAELIEIPPKPDMGDLALPCFKLAKKFRKAPPEIAEELKDKIPLPDFLEDISVVGGYLNFYYDKPKYIEALMKELAEAGENWGKSDIGQGRKVLLDYSSINIAKPFHIGHLSSTAIGGALYKIFKYLGYEAVGINHLGDWGTQFGKMIAAYKLWGDDEEINKNSVNALMELYVRFHKEAEDNPELDDLGRYWFKKIEDGDEEALRIFNWFSELTFREVNKIYDKLDVKFDSYAGESFYNDKVAAVIEELEEKGLLEQSEGAYIVRLDEEEMPPAIILKKDGTTLYATRDLAAAEYRKKTYDFYKNLYVVAYQQNLHFNQLFAVLKKMGHDWADDCVHVPFGMVSLEDGAMKTRTGNVMLLNDVLNQAVDKTKAIIEEKSPDLENKEEIAADVGIGAVIYSTLSQNRIKDIVFSFDRVLNFDGETGPYVQYTHARCASLLRKADRNIDEDAEYSVLNNEQALKVLKLIEEFPNAVSDAAEKYEPFFITRNITELAKAFNKYYFDYRIIDEDKAATNARLQLARAVKNTIKRGLNLLGIRAPEKM